MNFRILAIITSIVTLILGVGYLFFGGLVLGRWQIEITEGVSVLARRMGALYLGLAVIYFIIRSASKSIARTAVIAGTTVALLLLVILGIYELSTGHVGNGILASIVIEFLLALGYFRVLYTDRGTANEDYLAG